MRGHPTPDPELNSVLEELVTNVQVALGDPFVGAYLQGSFAVGDFDVDFVIAVSDELSDDQVIALQAMHERVYGLGSEWARHLEGSYFPAGILRDYRQRTPARSARARRGQRRPSTRHGLPLLLGRGMDVRTRPSGFGSRRTPRTSRAPYSL